MKKQNKAAVLFRMVKLVKPLTGFMLAAILMGTLGFLCAPSSSRSSALMRSWEG